MKVKGLVWVLFALVAVPYVEPTRMSRAHARKHQVDNMGLRVNPYAQPVEITPDDAVAPLRFAGTVDSQFLQVSHLQILKGGFSNAIRVFSDQATSAERLEVNHLQAETVITPLLQARNLARNEEAQIVAIGKLLVTGKLKYAASDDSRGQGGTVLLEQGVSVYSHNDEHEDMDTAVHWDEDGDATRAYHRQWHVAAHDDFTDADHHNGWQHGDGRPVTPADLATCHDRTASQFLALPCDAPALNVTKRFTLPPHTQVEVQARVHLLDAAHGLTAFALVDGAYVWVETYDAALDDVVSAATRSSSSSSSSSSSPLKLSVRRPNLCGDDNAYDRLSVPIKVVVPHSADTLQLTVGFQASIIPPAAGQRCEGSLGVDDVMLLVH